jgi:hypothetical protein
MNIPTWVQLHFRSNRSTDLYDLNQACRNCQETQTLCEEIAQDIKQKVANGDSYRGDVQVGKSGYSVTELEGEKCHGACDSLQTLDQLCVLNDMENYFVRIYHLAKFEEKCVIYQELMGGDGKKLCTEYKTRKNRARYEKQLDNCWTGLLNSLDVLHDHRFYYDTKLENIRYSNVDNFTLKWVGTGCLCTEDAYSHEYKVARALFKAGLAIYEMLTGKKIPPEILGDKVKIDHEIDNVTECKGLRNKLKKCLSTEFMQMKLSLSRHSLTQKV